MRVFRIAMMAVAVCGLAGVPAMTATAAPASNACPGNQILERAGAFTATSNGSGSGLAGVFTTNTGPQSFDRNAHFSWSVRGTVTGNQSPGGPGSIDGGLTLQIIFRGRQVSFQSICILDAFVDNGQVDPAIQSMSARFQGTVTGFPGGPAQNQSPAIGSISVGRNSNGSLDAFPFVRVGTDPCNGDTIEFDGGNVQSGNLNAPNQSSEREVSGAFC